MSAVPSTPEPRRHDLDALRAFAMLLGIALHAALSFTSFPWIVQDLHPNGGFLVLFAAIHGFRMPLFILVSGYFTMMLWRKRGMAALLKQRFWRVLVPCLIGLVTVVPAMDWAIARAMAMKTAQDSRGRPPVLEKSDLVEALRARDLAGLERLLEAGANPGQVDPEFGIPPLHWAAMHGDEAAATLLIDRGADVNGVDRAGYRALHSAAFLGHFGVADLLIRRGADPSARGPRGDTASDSMKMSPAITRMVVAGLRIPVRDDEALLAGRTRCRGLLGRLVPGGAEVAPAAPVGWDAVRARYAEFLSSRRFLVGSRAGSEPIHLFLTSVFHHLWFLWYLCWLVAIFAVVAPLADRLAPGQGLGRLARSPLRWLLVVPLTMIPQALMGSLTPGFGPDTSAGLLPQPHLLLYYAVFFGFGAIYYDADDREGRLGRYWWLTLPLALLVLLPAGLLTAQQAWWRTGPFQVAYAWAMSFALMGLFRRALARERPAIRYLADSAYWLYLAHLPLVILLQAWVRDWDRPALPKFLLVCLVTTAGLLVSYRWLVRETWIGRLLNGPRPRRAALAVEPVSASPAVSGP